MNPRHGLAVILLIGAVLLTSCGQASDGTLTRLPTDLPSPILTTTPTEIVVVRLDSVDKTFGVMVPIPDYFPANLNLPEAANVELRQGQPFGALLPFLPDASDPLTGFRAMLITLQRRPIPEGFDVGEVLQISNTPVNVADLTPGGTVRVFTAEWPLHDFFATLDLEANLLVPAKDVRDEGLRVVESIIRQDAKR